MAPSIVVKALCGGYEGNQIFRGLSFSIERGKFVALLGPNGSGKSTLLKFLYRELKPARGSVSLLGRDIASLSTREISRLVSLVPQNGMVASGFTVRETVEMASYTGHGMSADEALSACGLEELGGKNAACISGGEFQRLLIARALHQGSSILLLDEPANNLDIAYQKSLFRLFRKIADSGITVLCVLHDMVLSQLYSDEAILLSGGTIIARGKSDEVITKETVRRVYAVESEEVTLPSTGRKILLPLS